MVIKNVNLFLEDRQFHQGSVVIGNGRFAEIRLGEETGAGDGEGVIDGEGALAIPGLIDTHFHGALGQDVCDGTIEAYRTIADYELSVGVTAICPATLTLSVDELCHVLEVGAAFAAAQRSGNEGGADLIGFNMEGPFISHVKKGAQNEAYILPTNIDVVHAFMEASDGLVRFIGLAPEENPDYAEFIREVRGINDVYQLNESFGLLASSDGTTEHSGMNRRGIHPYVQVSLAHSNADYETAFGAFRAGASRAVHLYNAMTGLNHRSPGAIGAISDQAELYAAEHGGRSARDYSVEIICDGVHIHPSAVRAAFRMIGSEYMVMISDSLRPVGITDGEYVLGGQAILKQGNICRLKEDGNIAGSVTNLADCMRTAVREMGIPLEVAIAACTINAAQSIHEDADYGSIAPGRHGDMVLLAPDERLGLRSVIKSGRIVRSSL